ncbi:zinc finger protein OZF [Gracilaria domingensis]|nr:zinc finger protein OZF [Gracilaria domingensis]
MSVLPSFKSAFSSYANERARAPVPELPIALQPGSAPAFGFSRAPGARRLTPLPLQLLDNEFPRRLPSPPFPPASKRPRAAADASPHVEVIEDSTGRVPLDVLSSPAQRSLNTAFTAKTLRVPSTAPHTLSLSHGPTRSDLSHLLRCARDEESVGVRHEGSFRARDRAQPPQQLQHQQQQQQQAGAASWSLSQSRSNTLPALTNVPFDTSSAPLPPPPCLPRGAAGMTTMGVGAQRFDGRNKETERERESRALPPVRRAGDATSMDKTLMRKTGTDKNSADGKTVQCPHCSRWLRNQVTLQNHIRVVHLHSGTFQCDQCKGTFMWQSTLGNHVRLVHQKQKPFPCDQCDKSFRWKSHLKEHFSVVHRGEKPFRCAMCGKSFGRKNNMQKHVRKHKEKAAAASVAAASAAAASAAAAAAAAGTTSRAR